MEKEIRARVLLVDDEEEFTQTLAQRLEARRLKVKAVNRGEEAIQLADQQEFDAIVLDLSMPGMDGLATLQAIKEKHPEAEIIMLTGHGSIEAGVQAMKLGAGDFLEKPVDIHNLLEKIDEAHRKHVLVLKQRSKEEITKILKSKPW